MIPEIKKILYATDLSDTARHAFGYAALLANRHDARIIVMCVLEELSPFARTMVEEILGEQRWQQLVGEKKARVIARLKERLEKFCDDSRRQSPECPFVIEKIVVEAGHPVDQIVRCADEMNVDLIVMGSRGKGGLSDVTLGSTSRRVLRQCRRPVLIVCRPPERE